MSGESRLAEELARWAIGYVRSLPAGRQPYDTKAGPADLVTAADTAIERHVREAAAQRFPGHRVVGEELGGGAGAAGGDRAPTWYVDPIDGTTNFAHGLGGSSFSLALADIDGEPVVGVVADLSAGSVVSAVRGEGCRLDGEPVRCAEVDGIAGEVVVTELLGHRPWEGMPAMLDALAAASCTTRILGSSALDLAKVASGRAAAAVLGGYNTWDVLAGVLLCREAGAVVLSREGRADGLPRGGTLPGGVPRDGLLAAAPGVADAVHRAWTGR